MMIPKVIFRVSENYNTIVENSDTSDKYPSYEELKKYASTVQELWRKHESSILNRISEIVQLPWTWNKIECYVVGKGKSFAFPLTMSMWSEKRDFIDVLSHELIHRIEHQHQVHRTTWLQYLNKKYEEESQHTRNHLLLFSVHTKIYLELLKDKTRLKRNVERNKDLLDYQRAWHIVQQEGADAIITKFHEVTQ